ncbi:MAG: aldo/keto reductase [Streptomycetaceae bacterium]|nr:aldo/keto reductase [Streptomycetaceae bacterium]
MRYATLGRSGLQVAPLCLGAMNFGTSGGVAGCDEAEARRIVDAYLDAGGNMIDTADMYAAGESERIVGAAIRGRRDQVVLATKAYMPTGVGPNDRGLSRGHLTRALEASLRRLGTDHVDLYQCHQWDPRTPIEETMATLDGFVRAGKVRYLGCSNFSAAQIVEAQWAADRAHTTPFISNQAEYSLITRTAEAEIVPVGERHGLGVLAWSPLGGGVLTGKYVPGGDADPDSRIARLYAMPTAAAHTWADGMLAERNLAIAGHVVAAAEELGATPVAVALAWLRQRPGVASVVIGPRSTGQLAGNLAALDLTLPAPIADRLDEASHPAKI